MKSNIETKSGAPIGLSRQEIKNQTSRHLAADLIERTLQMNSSDTALLLIQIADSGLLESIPECHRMAHTLSMGAGEIEDRLSTFFPASCDRIRARFSQRRAVTLVEQVQLFRQETAWTKSDPAAAHTAERLISELDGFYREVESLMRAVDAVSEGGPQRRRPIPDLRATDGTLAA